MLAELSDDVDDDPFELKSKKGKYSCQWICFQIWNGLPMQTKISIEWSLQRALHRAIWNWILLQCMFHSLTKVFVTKLWIVEDLLQYSTFKLKSIYNK